MRQPFLEADRDRRHASARSNDGCFGDACGFFCFVCGRGRSLCCRSVSVFLCLSVALWKGITRNFYCNPAALAAVEPPYGGEIIPGNITLVERKYFFQFTKIVDVYDQDSVHVGYFYDINLFIIMRFGFSDASNRIWFEARYASFLSRFKPIVEYTLQRCDAGAGGRSTDLFELKEDWWRESWFCVYHCNRLFNLSRRETHAHVAEHLLPEAGFAQDAIARVVFDSTLTPTFRGKMTEPVENAGIGFRHRWLMWVLNASSGDELAEAKQHFVTGASDSNFNVLSRWNLTLAASREGVPNWVIAFLSVLDDIEEEYR